MKTRFRTLANSIFKVPESKVRVVCHAASQELGIDRIELRRRNMIQPAAMPYKIGLGPVYERGNFVSKLTIALDIGDYAGFADRREASRACGKLCGIAEVNAIEQATGPVPEYAEIRFQPSGSAMLMMGTKTHGQGHETIFEQILNEKLGIDPNEGHFIDGDTDRVAFGMGSNGSRAVVVEGAALVLAAERVIAKEKS
jgi:carbon-monoxide dehydrogenase large subunit